MITRNAQRELRLVDDLLTLVSMKGGGLRIRSGLVDLELVVGHAVAGAQPNADDQGVALTGNGEGVAVLVKGDADRIGQAIDNLISNAVKFTPRGGSVRVSLRTGRDVARVEVADSGSGIGDAESDRIFERLYRSESAIVDQIPGAGLGLTIALAIAVAHQGTIGVVKTDETGATFRLQLPLTQAAN